MPTHARDARAVGILQLGREVIPDVAGEAAAVLAATHPVEFRRRAAEGPVHHVEIMDVLLDDLIAAQPVPVIPVPALPFEIAELGEPAGLLAKPYPLIVPVALPADELADGAVVDALHNLHVTRLVPTLRAGDDREFFLFRDLRRRDHRPAANGIDRDGFFHEHIFPRRDRRLEMHRPEARRRREDHEVDVGREDFLVGVEAPETLRGVEFEFRFRCRDLPLKQIAHGHDLNARGRIEAVLRRAGAAPAAADEPDADAIRAGGGAESARRGEVGGERRAAGDGGEFHEITTRQGGSDRGVHG